MAAMQRSTIVGVFSDHKQADKAVSELRKAGFSESQIGVAMKNVEGVTSSEDTTTAEGGHAGSGALTGVLTGLGLGALAGLGVLSGVIPVIGPAIAAGTLGVLFSNAALGAGVVGLAGALIGAGIPEEEAHYYESELESGRTIVTVQAEGRADEATTILRRYGAYDMQTRGTGTAATGSQMSTSSGAMTSGSRMASGAGNQKIEVREEELQAHTRPVDAGEVRVRKDVVTEHKTIDVPVEREEVVVERHPASGRATSGDIRAGEEIRIPVKEEEVVVDKQTMVKEEVEVGKRKVQETEHVAGDVRKEKVRVEQKGDVDVRGDMGKGGKA